MQPIRTAVAARLATLGLLSLFLVTSLTSSALAQQPTPPPEESVEDPVPEDDDTDLSEPEEGEGVAPAPGDIEETGVPLNVRLRRLERDVQSLKERAWRSKARVGMLKEQVIGGGVGARVQLIHNNKMGRSFRLAQAVYAVDGTQVFAKSGDELDADQKTIEVMTGPIAPGNHTISVLLVFRGSGFGPFKYLKKYKYTVRSSHTFTAAEGKLTRIEVVAFEKGGWTTQMRDRPSIDYRVTTLEGVPEE